MPVKAVSELTAPDLVKQWKKLVNDNIIIGRDAALIKQRLEYLTSVQILLGMHQYVGEKTISIPQFLKQESDWLVEDSITAQIELAAAMANTRPAAYLIWQDLRYEDPTYENMEEYRKAKNELVKWSERVIS